MEFLSHVSLPGNKSVVKSGSKVVKTWRVQNISEKPWLEGTKIIFQNGNREASSQDEVKVPIANPGQKVDVSVILTPPSKQGKYKLSYKLATANGATFGPFLKANFIVKDPVTIAPGSAPPTDPGSLPIAPVRQVWKEQKDKLREMGFFKDDNILDPLLNRFKGDIQQVVLELTKSTTCHNNVY